MKKLEQRVPNLRFKGFTDDWEQHKLEEIAEFYNGDRVPNYPKPSEIVEQGVPFINAGDLINGHIDYRNCKHITSDKFNQLNGAKLKINDIVYCLRGTIGKNGLVNSDANATIASSLVCIRPVKLRPLFLFQILNSSIEERQRKMVDEGAAQPNISATNLKKFLIPVPNDNEQEKIGEVFSKLNHLITLQQHKLDLLKQLKKGLLQKMFADKDSKRPVLRFKGFHDDWEQHKLRKVACINPKTNIPDNFKYVDLESVVGTSLIKAKLTTKQLAPSRAQRVAKKGDIFYQTVRPYQKNNFLFDINNYDFQYVFSTGYAQLRSEINNYFLFSYLQRQRFVNLILRRSTGTSYPAISSKDLSEIKIIFPRNSKEQENIGKIINLIDALITLQQQKLAKYQSIKKSLLQQMFI